MWGVRKAKSGILVDGQHDWQLIRQVRRSLQKDTSFKQGLFDKLVLLIILLKESFFQVSHAAMNKFGGSGACPRGKIVLFDQHGRKTTSGCVQCTTSCTSFVSTTNRHTASGATANYQEIEMLGLGETGNV